MFNFAQFDKLIVTPVLSTFQLDNEGWHFLINGTVGHESLGGTYLKQIEGTALGIGQMETLTHDSIWQTYLPHNAAISHKLMVLCQFARAPKAQQLIHDLMYSVCMMVILYKWRIDSHKERHPLTLEEAAQIWKTYYNTSKGKGTVEQFINDYRKFAGIKQQAKGKGNS